MQSIRVELHHSLQSIASGFRSLGAVDATSDVAVAQSGAKEGIPMAYKIFLAAYALVMIAVAGWL